MHQRKWPLPLSAGPGSRPCNQSRDELGDHVAACQRIGRLKLRAADMVLRVARGGRQSEGTCLLRDMGMQNLDPCDGRHFEIVARGLPLGRGVPMAMGVTLVSPLRADGMPLAWAEVAPSVSLHRASTRKRATYPELACGERLTFLTAALEAGGKLSDEAR